MASSSRTCLCQLQRALARDARRAGKAVAARHQSSNAAASSSTSQKPFTPFGSNPPLASFDALDRTPAIEAERTETGETPITGFRSIWATTMEELANYSFQGAGPEERAAWVQEHLAPLEVDTTLAARTLTHPLSVGPHGNHNGKLAALGAWVLKAHLSAFVNLHRSELPDDFILDSTWIKEVLSIEQLGKGPGEAMGVGKVMLYRLPDGVDGANFPRIIHRGQVIEALTGFVHKQYGAVTSLRFFNSRILPHLSLPSEWSASISRAAEQDADLSGGSSYLIDAVTARQKRVLQEA